MIEHRIELLLKLKAYIVSNTPEFIMIKEKAERQNAWFTQSFILQSLTSICDQYLNESSLRSFADKFKFVEKNEDRKTIGIVMAGNIPLVGFHDFLCVFLSGHIQRIKFSSKDDVLLAHLIQKLYEWDDQVHTIVSASEMLKSCDAYIATGSNNSANYFEQYFAKYPHIIRRNRTSVAILSGSESTHDLELLADDVYLYFGLGCRNVTKLYVPEHYDFVPLLEAFKKYDELKHHNKYKNNYDYNLALFMLNKQFYMTNESILLIENESIFSAISVLHYEYYSSVSDCEKKLLLNESIQAIAGAHHIPFGSAQTPALLDFADGINTIEFINSL